MEKVSDKSSKSREIVRQIKNEISQLIDLTKESKTKQNKLNQRIDSIKGEIKEINYKENNLVKLHDYKDIIIRKKLIFNKTSKRSRNFFSWLLNNKYN
jgi:hypothetical protein